MRIEIRVSSQMPLVQEQERKLGKEALTRGEAFIIGLKYSAEEHIALKASKTATVY